jgi:transposase InsO family protein
VADLVQVPTGEGWLYLGVILDVWHRGVVGWAMRQDARAELVVDALEMALWRRRPAPGLVHHSDRGSQYSSLRFGAGLRAARILPSMGRKGDAYDNALCEAFFATLHREVLSRCRFSAPATRLVRCCSPTWRGSTTGGGILLWGTCPRKSSRGGGQRILNLSVLPRLLKRGKSNEPLSGPLLHLTVAAAVRGPAGGSTT